MRSRQNSAIIPHICTEFDTEAENGIPQLDLPSKFTKCNNPRWRSPPFSDQFNGNNSVIYSFLNGFTPNLTQTLKVRSRNWVLAKLISRKIQDGDECHIVNHICGHNWVTIVYICTEFDTVPDLPPVVTRAKRWRGPPCRFEWICSLRQIWNRRRKWALEQDSSSKFTSAKIEHGSCRHFAKRR